MGVDVWKLCEFDGNTSCVSSGSGRISSDATASLSSSIMQVFVLAYV